MSSMWLDMAGCEYRLAYAQAGPIRTRYLEAGFGRRETIVFLHGSGGYLEAYLRNIRAHAERYRVFAIDMIGHGFTDAPPDLDYTTDDVIDHVVRFMDTAGIDTADLCGESFGGRVAVGRHGEIVSGEGADQHQQRGAGEMKVGDEPVHHPKDVARADEQ